ncbi:MAG: hypothetical protein LC796_04805 [Acidobacteria bacterium]|nr:hypothetical protein [Acidobacteriota bacterium]MCA1609638.1 hypothetical protein [Acidobacteriota bacterium]
MTKLTPNQSHYVLNALLSQKAVRPTQIEKALRGRDQEIRNLREQLASLESLSESGARSSARRRGRPQADGRTASKPRARRPMSPKVRALRRLQGKYMGYVRGLKPAEKARVRTVREKQGMNAAIELATSLAAKS